MLNEVLLRQLFDEAVTRSGAFGAQLSIIKGGQQVDFAAGLAHAQRGLPMTPHTLMQIGSITKLFNAVIVVSLAEEGMLDLETPVQRYIAGFEVADAQASRTLTLRHLLSMSSGLDNGPYAYFGGDEDALSHYVDHLRSLPQHFPPGKYFGYSNAGICIAGHVASRVTGKPWETLLRERILEPGGLTQSAVLDADVVNQSVSAGHFPLPDGKLEIVDPVFDNLRARVPSGPSLALSTGHLARFGKIFVTRGVADTGARILSLSAVERMMSPQTQVPIQKYGSRWCLGPYTGDWNGVQVWGHGGTSTTSTSFLHWIPEHQGVIAFIVNTHAAMGDFSSIVFDEILQSAFGFSKPRLDRPQEGSAAVDYGRYVGTYEELGMTMEVTPGDGDTLRARLIPKPTAHELVMRRGEQSATLTPLGSDRFLVNPTEGPDKHRGVVDMAFFGDDGKGRATNALNLVFPMSRVENEL